jgi:hypothetical protein
VAEAVRPAGARGRQAAAPVEQENGRLKKLVAERDLEIEVMKEITQNTGRRADSSATGAVRDHATEIPLW